MGKLKAGSFSSQVLAWRQNIFFYLYLLVPTYSFYFQVVQHYPMWTWSLAPCLNSVSLHRWILEWCVLWSPAHAAIQTSATPKASLVTISMRMYCLVASVNATIKTFDLIACWKVELKWIVFIDSSMRKVWVYELDFNSILKLACLPKNEIQPNYLFSEMI